MTKFTLRFSNFAILAFIALSADPKWMGTFPSRIQWGIESENIYFQYNLENDPDDSLYKINLSNQSKIVKVSQQEQDKMIPRYGDYNSKQSL